MGRNSTCIPTEKETQYGRKESGAIGNGPSLAIPSGYALAASAASEARYGPRNTVPTVVLKALLAQSYMAQPNVSRLSFTGTAAAVAVIFVSRKKYSLF